MACCTVIISNENGVILPRNYLVIRCRNRRGEPGSKIGCWYASMCAELCDVSAFVGVFVEIALSSAISLRCFALNVILDFCPASINHKRDLVDNRSVCIYITVCFYIHTYIHYTHTYLHAYTCSHNTHSFATRHRVGQKPCDHQHCCRHDCSNPHQGHYRWIPAHNV